MKTNRRAIYVGSLRIISVQGDRWQLQRRLTDKMGSHATRTVRHFDPWEAVARPTSLGKALDQLRTRVKGSQLPGFVPL